MAASAEAKLIAIILGVAVAGVAPALGKDRSSEIKRGGRILAKNCSRCHAIGRTGASPHPQAPPFRTLSQRYPVDALSEALGEGLSTGHPDMPEFVFPPHDIGAILSYLRSIQQK